MALPAKLQNDLKQFQRLQQELALVDQQRAQVDMKLRETTQALDEIKGLPEDAILYRPVGGILVRAKSRQEIEDILGEEKETLEVRLRALERQVTHLKERYQSMQKELSASLQAAGVGVVEGDEGSS
jgi:prefoldin beta subunit